MVIQTFVAVGVEVPEEVVADAAMDVEEAEVAIMVAEDHSKTKAPMIQLHPETIPSNNRLIANESYSLSNNRLNNRSHDEFIASSYNRLIYLFWLKEIL